VFQENSTPTMTRTLIMPEENLVPIM
jgi:hypothetical protein